MSNLVPEDAGQFSLVINGSKQAASHIDIATRCSKSINHRRVHNLEAPVQSRAVGESPHPHAKCLHVSLQLIVFINTILFNNRLIRLHAQLRFILFTQKHKLLLSGHRINGTATQKCQDRHQD